MRFSFFIASAVTAWSLIATNAFAINAVNPTGVNVRSNAPNTVFITFQGLEPNERAIEALWCGTVQPGGRASRCILALSASSAEVDGAFLFHNRLTCPGGEIGRHIGLKIRRFPA